MCLFQLSIDYEAQRRQQLHIVLIQSHISYWNQILQHISHVQNDVILKRENKRDMHIKQDTDMTSLSYMVKE